MKYKNILIILTILIIIFNLIVYKLVKHHNIELPLYKKGFNNFCQNNKYEKVKEKGFFSDKQQVKQYIIDNHPELKVAKTLFKTKNPEELRNFNFPPNFVLKCTSGARMFIIVENGIYDLDHLVEESKRFLNIDYSTYHYRKIPFMGFEEPHYKYNDKSIIIEEFLDNIEEFRIMAIKNKIIYYDHVPNYFDSNFNKINIDKENYLDNDKLVKPKKLELMIDFVNEFYQKNKIDLVRYDFLLRGDDIYFGELTFTPDNCRRKYSKKYNDFIYDNYIKDI